MAKPDLTINSIPLHRGQRLFVDKVLSHENRNVFYWACVTPRQYGKTTLITQMMTYYAVTDPGSHCFYAAPTYSLSKKQFKFILKGLKDTGLVKSSDASDYIIELTNGSTLSFKSVAVPENLRGDSVTYMFLDEFALYKEEVFTAILKPMLSVRGKRCFMLSTPRGKNYFYKLYQWGLDDSMYRYGSFRGDASLNPFANRDEIEDARRTLPKDIFDQEYNAVFIDDSGSVFRHIADAQRVHKWANPGPRCFAGLDVGVTGDFMVLTIMDEKGSVLYVYRDTQKPIAELVAKVGEALRKYSPTVCLVEVNGVGQGLFDRFKREYSKCQEWVTTNDSKQDIISDLIMSFDDLEIAIPSRQLLPELSDELSLFGFEFSPKTRKITYKATTGHDDLVISLALADHARRRYANYGKYRVL